MRRALGLAAVFALVVAVRLSTGQEANAASAAMALGFVLLVAFALGRVAPRIGLPAISGYIGVGMLCGPYLLGWVHPAFAVLGQSAVSSLRLLDSVALGLIALSAGGELRLEALRRHARTIGAVIAGQLGLVFAGVAGLVYVTAGLFPSLADLEGGRLAAAALLFAVMATANSPATALAIIQEVRSTGPVTDVVLAVTVAKDVAVISLFAVVLSVSVVMARPEAAFDAAFLGALAWEVLGSVALGGLLGWGVAAYMRRLGHELPLLVLGVAFCAVAVLPELHLSGLLALMVAGFTIENFSAQGEALLEAVARHSLPVYVVFFTLAGASLDLGALGATLPLALGLALLRGALTAGGTALGARWSGAPRAVVRLGWSGFVAQAGVTLGFAILVEQRFPELGPTVKTVTLAVIALNQLAGPVLFRYGLFRAGEARTPARG
jgi:Kef-type K+ transport system membrane component KefB